MTLEIVHFNAADPGGARDGLPLPGGSGHPMAGGPVMPESSIPCVSPRLCASAVRVLQ